MISLVICLLIYLRGLSTYSNFYDKIIEKISKEISVNFIKASLVKVSLPSIRLYCYITDSLPNKLTDER